LRPTKKTIDQIDFFRSLMASMPAKG